MVEVPNDTPPTLFLLLTMAPRTLPLARMHETHTWSETGHQQSLCKAGLGQAKLTYRQRNKTVNNPLAKQGL